MNLNRVTLTGIDAATDLERVVDLSERFPFVEWGVLYSRDRGGQEPRYQTIEDISGVFCDIHRLRGETPVNMALHLCGEAATGVLKGDTDSLMLQGYLKPFGGGRVQMNINHAKNQATGVAAEPAHWLAYLQEAERIHEGRIRTIFQVNDNNMLLTQWLMDQWHKLSCVDFLQDESGGRGQLAETWYAAPFAIQESSFGWGYAGGLSPDNLDEQLADMAATLGNKAQDRSIDMEGGIRTNDQLDLDKCEQVLKIAEDFIRSQPKIDAKPVPTSPSP